MKVEQLTVTSKIIEKKLWLVKQPKIFLNSNSNFDKDFPIEIAKKPKFFFDL